MRSSLVTLLLMTLTAHTAAAEPPAGDFLWLEDITGADALDWVEAQNARSLAVLESDPAFDSLYRAASEILTSEDRIPTGRIQGDHVVNFWRDLNHPRGVLRRSPLKGYARGEPAWEELLDVDWLAKSEGENWVFKGYDCLAPRYDRCMIQLSRGGTDASVFREYSLEQRNMLRQGFNLPEAKSALAWLDTNTLLVATDWGAGSLTKSGYPREVRRWQRGQPLEEAKPVFTAARDDVRAVPVVYRSGGINYAILIRQPTFFEREYHYLSDGDAPIRLPLPLRARLQGAQAGRVAVLLDEDWQHGDVTFSRGSLIAYDLDRGSAEPVYVLGRGEAIQQVEVGDSAVLITVLDDVVGRAKRLVRRGDHWRASPLRLPDNGAVTIMSLGEEGDALIGYESLTVPRTLYYLSPRDRLSKVFQMPAFYDAADVAVEQRFATSRDGTRVPYFQMGRRAVLARGDAPTIQYGYGGFLLPTLPLYFDEDARPQHGALAGRLWVDRGGVLVLANIRGGGEYGPAWHDAALARDRHRAFEDFFAVSEDLIARGVTTPDRLGALGRSNGGLLMGVALTERPDLYAAIDCGVPLIDMLRYHELLAGASWMAEYGDPDDPADRAVLGSYSPLQHLRKDGEYPEIFIYTSTRDDRVHPGHARRLAATLAALEQPFLYYENYEGGHGGAANQQQLALRIALEFTYFTRTLMESRAAPAGG